MAKLFYVSLLPYATACPRLKTVIRANAAAKTPRDKKQLPLKTLKEFIFARLSFSLW
jgi:hypothetical protein